MSTNSDCQVYVLTNEAIPGLVKIGMTTLDDPSQRADQLYTTGVPLPFDVEYSAKVPRAKDIEAALHNAFRDSRVNPKREFFEIQADQAIGILKLFDLEETTDELRDTFKKSISAAEQSAVEKARRRRPPLNFEEMAIPNGATLSFNKNENITATVVEPKKVEFEDEIRSLTALTTDLLKLEYSIQPTPHWSYEGTSLSEIYDLTYRSAE